MDVMLVLQKRLIDSQVNLQAGLDSTMRESLRRIVRERGVLGLYRGMGLNFLKSAPAVGVTFTT